MLRTLIRHRSSSSVVPACRNLITFRTLTPFGVRIPKLFLWGQHSTSTGTSSVYPIRKIHNRRFSGGTLSLNPSFPLRHTMGPDKIEYPVLKEDPTVIEDYHGTPIADPFRWLENPDSEEVKEFVEKQNAVTVPFLEKCEVRGAIEQRLTELWNYPKYSCPYKRGNRFFYFKNTGLQNQSVLYVQDSLNEEGKVFLDPNQLSEDGTVAISTYKFSDDGETFAYGLSVSGSDWISIHFKKVSSGENYPEVLHKVKFSSIAWTIDNKGIFYGRYPEQEGKTDGSETTSNEHQKLYYHLLGNNQSEDILVVEFLDNPKWRVAAEVSDCGQYLLVLPQQDCRDNLVFFADISEQMRCGFNSKLQLTPVVSKYEADYDYVTNDGPKFHFRTSKGAPNYRIATIDFSKPISEDAWSTLVPEHPKNVLDWAACVNRDKLVICYIEDVKNTLELKRLQDGSHIHNFSLDVGTITGYSGKRQQNEFFYQFASFLSPGRIFHVDLGASPTPITAKLIREVHLEGFDASQFETRQIFYSSKDGTQIPMFIVNKKSVKMDGNNACLLYGYGGFNISVQPAFSVTRLVFMQHFDGIVAIPNIRGGGEYGEKWHNGGRLLNKQNSFDDFQYAAQYLIDKKISSAKKIVIQGASNGGLLIGACINQRPELFGSAIAQVGVMDMLRFHKFTIGYAWCSDYGNPDEKIHFDNLIKFSPVHNVKVPEDKAKQYPSVLMLTADHDDRVSPLHSFKFIARLQKEVGRHPNQSNPLLIRIETKAGHGAGKPTRKIIEEHTDILSFLVQTLGITFKP